MGNVTPVRFAPYKYGDQLLVDSTSWPCWTGIVPDGQLHTLDFHEFLVVTAGRAQMDINGRSIHVNGPSVVFTPPGVVRRVEVADPLDLRLVVFVATAMPQFEFRPLLGFEGGLQTSRGCAVALLSGIAYRMAQELVTPRPDSALMLEALLAQFLVTASRARSHAPGVRKPALVARFERLLERRFREEHHVGAYAAALGVSSDHLSAVVRGHDRHSAKSAIDQRLFSEAAALLTVTDRSVAAIAADLGYDEPGHFARAFKRACGLSPGRYRSSG